MKLATVICSVFSIISLGQACSLITGGSSDPSTCQNLQATPLVTTSNSQFGPFIEGTSVNTAGQIFATNFGNANTLNQVGVVTATQRLLYTDPNGNSYLNGIRFYNPSFDTHKAYLADVNNHRVVELSLNAQDDSFVSSRTFCQDNSVLQPNDLTISRSGRIFLSGMNWLDNTGNTDGHIWTCSSQGDIRRLEVMGRTNGIELSPDDRRLYVSESYNRNGSPYEQKIWLYDVDVETGNISNKRLFADFSQIDNTGSVDIDGMRTDTLGNLYVTRHGAAQVKIFNPSGTVIGTIGLNFQRPTNLEFGGAQGNILYIVGSCQADYPGNNGCVDYIQLTNVGRAFTNLQR